MGITYKGHSLDWIYWVFDIDGREWVAVNRSTPQPLNILFQGRYRNWGNTPISKAGGFDILSSTTTTKPNTMGEKQGTVEWIWNGVRYKSSWVLLAGNEIVAAFEGAPAEYDYELGFVGYVPYDGPTGGAVGTGVVSQKTIEASKQEVNTGPSGSGYTAPKAVEVPSAPYGGPSGSGYVEPPAQKPVGTGVASSEVIKAQQEVNTGPSGSGYTAPKAVEVPSAPYGGPSGGGAVTKIPKVVFTPSTPYGGPSGSLPADTAAGPDWVKLGLQLGAAYLLLS